MCIKTLVAICLTSLMISSSLLALAPDSELNEEALEASWQLKTEVERLSPKPISESAGVLGAVSPEALISQAKTSVPTQVIVLIGMLLISLVVAILIVELWIGLAVFSLWGSIASFAIMIFLFLVLYGAMFDLKKVGLGDPHTSPSLESSVDTVSSQEAMVATPDSVVDLVQVIKDPQKKERFLKTEMQKILQGHAGHHNLECGYDMTLLWMCLRGISRGDHSYRIDDLRNFFKHVTKKYGENHAEFRDILANVEWSTRALELLFGIWPKLEGVDSRYQYEMISLDKKEEKWAETLSNMKKFVDEDAVVLLRGDHGLYMVYDVDLAQGTLKVIDPHKKYAELTQTWSHSHVANFKKFEMARLPSLDDTAMVQALRGEMRELNQTQSSLYSEIWGRLFKNLNFMHHKWYGLELMRHEDAQGQAYVSGIHPDFYARFNTFLESASTSADSIEQAVVKSFRDFDRHLQADKNRKANFADKKQLLRYILEEMPQRYYRMMRHYSYMPMNQEHVLELPTLESTVHVQKNQYVKDIEDPILQKVFEKTPALMELLVNEGVTIQWMRGLKTPAEYDSKKKVISLNHYFNNEDAVTFVTSQLLHELLRMSKDFKHLSTFQEMAAKFPAIWDGNLASIPEDLGVELDREVLLMKVELEWMKTHMEDDERKKLREYISKLYDDRVLRQSIEISEQGKILDWVQILEDFETPDTSQNIEELLKNYVAVATYA